MGKARKNTNRRKVVDEQEERLRDRMGKVREEGEDEERKVGRNGDRRVGKWGE